ARRAKRAAAPPPPKPRRPAWVPIAAALLVLAIVAAAVLLATRGRPPAPAPARDAASALHGPDAYREAIRLANASRALESLPYFRRALEGLTRDSWDVHYGYGITLASCALQYTPRLGEPRLETRSSVMRVGLVQEAMHQLDQASRLAPDARTRAQVL